MTKLKIAAQFRGVSRSRGANHGDMERNVHNDADIRNRLIPRSSAMLAHGSETDGGMDDISNTLMRRLARICGGCGTHPVPIALSGRRRHLTARGERCGETA